MASFFLQRFGPVAEECGSNESQNDDQADRIFDAEAHIPHDGAAATHDLTALILGKTVDAITKTVNPTEIRVDEVIQPSRGMRRTIESKAEK